MDALTKEELTAIKVKASKAMVGPWKVKDKKILLTFGDALFVPGCKYTSDNDIKFVAEARTDIPKLINEIERLWSNEDQKVQAVSKDKDKEIAALKAELVSLKKKHADEVEVLKERTYELQDMLSRVHSWVSPLQKQVINEALKGGTRAKLIKQSQEQSRLLAKSV